MTVSDLGQLLEAGDYRRCLAEAAAMLESGGHNEEEMARIWGAICRSRLELTDYYGAADAGEKATVLAERCQVADLLGFALLDAATAFSAVRQYDKALEAFRRFHSGLSSYTAARCMEGTALIRTADTYRRAGRMQEALRSYWQAHHWFQRYGDEASACDCARAILHLHLDLGDMVQAVPLLQENDRYATAHPGNREFLVEHLLDRSLFHMLLGDYQVSAQEAFQALDGVDGRLGQQARAHLLLCRNALAQQQIRDALGFALAARVSAIDGRLYDLEFEAAEIIFRLLREHGVRQLRELEGDYAAFGVNIFHYLSDEVLHRLSEAN